MPTAPIPNINENLTYLIALVVVWKIIRIVAYMYELCMNARFFALHRREIVLYLSLVRNMGTIWASTRTPNLNLNLNSFKFKLKSSTNCNGHFSTLRQLNLLDKIFA